MAQRTQRRRTFRLLPITVTMLSLLFVIKVNELYLGSRHLREIYGISDAQAEDKKEPAHGDAAKDAPKDAAKPAEKAADAKPVEEKISEAVKHQGDAAKEDGAAKEGGGHGDAGAKPPKEETTFGTGKTTVKEIEAMKAKDSQPVYTQTELDLLQNLAKRRDELDQRDKEIDLKAKVLEATEKRINDKIGEMKSLETELGKVVAQYNEKQDVQIKSLVKIYESMKPDEAAAIFNELDMPILLEVIAKMSERKVAPVLANMSPKRARDVTQELAERRKKSALSPNAPSALSPAPAPTK
ncbi:MAG: hypothetical protein V4735_00765 [Pseudomonadota bacterium]